MKKQLRTLFLFILAVAVIITAYPTATASAKPKNNGNDHHGNWKDWPDYREDWQNHWDDWNDYWQKWYDDWKKYTKDNHGNDYSEYATDYLVLVAQADGTYLAFDDMAYLSGSNKLMVRSKSLAKALGIPSKQLSGTGKHKKSSISYALNSSLKINYQYYDTSSNANYQYMGYRGVIVYSKIAKVSTLPDLSLVINLEDNPWYSQNNNNNNVTYITVKPSTVYHGSSSEYKYIEATYQSQQTSTPQLFNLSEVNAAFLADGLPSNGVYGYGYCDTAITLQGYNNANVLVGESKSPAGAFLIDFPTATQLKIIGATRNLLLDFTPVRPIVLTATSTLSFNQIAWIYPNDKYARQYFILADHMKLTPVNINYGYDYSRRMLNPTNSEPVDYANSYQRITVILKHTAAEPTPPGYYFYAEKTSQPVNNNLVVFPDTGNAVLAPDYSAKLLQMVNSLNKVGLNTYFPSKNWERQLIIKLPDNTTNTAYNLIYLDASYLNLDYFYDYYAHLHEMTHFYEATQLHYGFRFEAWTEGNAATLAKKAMDYMGVSHSDSQGTDLLDSIYATNYSFLTQDNKNNFETYYLNVTGWNASLIGYHFTDFLHDIYGKDVVSRILQKVYAANIPTGNGRNSTYDKQFTDCIKAATSSNVFSLFVEYCINKQS